MDKGLKLQSVHFHSTSKLNWWITALKQFHKYVCIYYIYISIYIAVELLLTGCFFVLRTILCRDCRVWKSPEISGSWNTRTNPSGTNQHATILCIVLLPHDWLTGYWWVYIKVNNTPLALDSDQTAAENAWQELVCFLTSKQIVQKDVRTGDAVSDLLFWKCLDDSLVLYFL